MKKSFLTIKDGPPALPWRRLRKPVYEHHSGQRLVDARSARRPWLQRLDGDSFIRARRRVQHEAYVAVHFDWTAIGAEAPGEGGEFQLVLTWNFPRRNLISLIRRAGSFRAGYEENSRKTTPLDLLSHITFLPRTNLKKIKKFPFIFNITLYSMIYLKMSITKMSDILKYTGCGTKLADLEGG